MILLIASVSMPFIPPFSFEKTYKAFARSTAVAAVGAAGPLGAAMLRTRLGRVPRDKEGGTSGRPGVPGQFSVIMMTGAKSARLQKAVSRALRKHGLARA